MTFPSLVTSPPQFSAPWVPFPSKSQFLTTSIPLAILESKPHVALFRPILSGPAMPLNGPTNVFLAKKQNPPPCFPSPPPLLIQEHRCSHGPVDIVGPPSPKATRTSSPCWQNNPLDWSHSSFLHFFLLLRRSIRFLLDLPFWCSTYPCVWGIEMWMWELGGRGGGTVR